MSTKMYGIIAAQNEDKVGETVIIDGVEDKITSFSSKTVC